jgi:DNA-directed RNA polymerase specialized sigma24 family protein
MRESVASLTPSLRRYAHALLGRWPVATCDAGARRRADQDADDLAHEALLGFWRAGLLRRDDSAVSAQPSIRLALLRCVTALAREAIAREQDSAWRGPDAGGLSRSEAFDSSGVFDSSGASSRRGARHFPWAPEARALPRLPFESRALLALAALERLDYQEIGAVLDMSAAQALAKLARARAKLASETTGLPQSHLRVACGLREADLHGYADDLLEPARRAEVAALLKLDAQAARRAQEWRRGTERLRGAFATLDAEPLPATLDFNRPRPARGRAAVRKTGIGSFIAWLLGAPRPAVAAP